MIGQLLGTMADLGIIAVCRGIAQRLEGSFTNVFQSFAGRLALHELVAAELFD
jgi:hypothetical protein